MSWVCHLNGTGPRSAVGNVQIQGSRVRSRPGPILSWRSFKKDCCQLKAKVCVRSTG